MSDLLTYSRVQDYLRSLVPPRPPEMREMEGYAKRQGFPAIGPVCGYFCYQIARMIRARKVFELGSGFGYSTAWFATAVRENGGGVVHHVVWDAELSERAKGHLDRLGYGDIVRLHVAEAIETLRRTKGPFDLIFNDIDKEGYPQSLPVIKEKLRSGGVLIIDNMLWDGRVLNPKNHEPTTEAIRVFTRGIVEDPEWIVSLVPMRDGMIVALKK